MVAQAGNFLLHVSLISTVTQTEVYFLHSTVLLRVRMRTFELEFRFYCAFHCTQLSQMRLSQFLKQQINKNVYLKKQPAERVTRHTPTYSIPSVVPTELSNTCC